MKKHHLLFILGGAALGFYFASTPNPDDGSNPIASIGGTVFGTLPQAVGLGSSPIVYAAEGAAFGYLLTHFIK